MIWILGTALLVAMGVLATMAASTLWFGKRALTRSDQLGDAGEELGRLVAMLAKRERTIDDRSRTISEIEKRLAREVAARKQTERQRDQALLSLAELGDPDGVAAVINASLEQLRTIANVSAVQGGDANDRDGPGEVHGATSPGDRSDGG